MVSFTWTSEMSRDLSEFIMASGSLATIVLYGIATCLVPSPRLMWNDDEYLDSDEEKEVEEKEEEEEKEIPLIVVKKIETIPTPPTTTVVTINDIDFEEM